MRSETEISSTTRTAQSRWVSLFFLALVLLSIPLRLTQLGHPLTGRHAFRQTQTAITVWSFVEDSVHPLAYRTPIFGPPWQVPMEFPTYQLAAAVPAALGMEIDAACRLTSILFFYLSALLLFGLCRHLVPNTRVAELAVTFYCWLPFGIFWSTQCMIDFTSVAFALGYTWAFLKWLENPRHPLWFAAALTAGALAYLTKVTTVVAFIPLIGTLILMTFFREMQTAGGLALFLRVRWKFIVGTVLLVLVPVITEYGWLVYSDHVKAGSPFTAWLTSANLADWNFGSLEQRLQLSNWALIGKPLGRALLPFTLPIMAVLGFVALRFHATRGRIFFLTTAAGIVAAVSAFFNLYVVHDYYLMAVTAPLAIVVGFGADLLLFRVFGKYPVAILVLLLFVADLTSREIFTPPADLAVYEHQFALHLREITAPDELLVVAERDWNPFILYYAQRRGFMLRGAGYGDPEIDGDQVTHFLKKHGFGVIVTITENHWLTTKWKQSVALPSMGGYFVYRVSDSPLDSGETGDPNGS